MLHDESPFPTPRSGPKPAQPGSAPRGPKPAVTRPAGKPARTKDDGLSAFKTLITLTSIAATVGGWAAFNASADAATAAPAAVAQADGFSVVYSTPLAAAPVAKATATPIPTPTPQPASRIVVPTIAPRAPVVAAPQVSLPRPRVATARSRSSR